MLIPANITLKAASGDTAAIAEAIKVARKDRQPRDARQEAEPRRRPPPVEIARRFPDNISRRTILPVPPLLLMPARHPSDGIPVPSFPNQGE